MNIPPLLFLGESFCRVKFLSSQPMVSTNFISSSLCLRSSTCFTVYSLWLWVEQRYQSESLSSIQTYYLLNFSRSQMRRWKAWEMETRTADYHFSNGTFQIRTMGATHIIRTLSLLLSYAVLFLYMLDKRLSQNIELILIKDFVDN